MCLWLARMAVATATVPNACRRWCVKIEIWLVWLTCVLLFSSSSFYYTMNINERTEVNGSRMGKLVLKENKRASKWVIRSEQHKNSIIFSVDVVLLHGALWWSVCTHKHQFIAISQNWIIDSLVYMLCRRRVLSCLFFLSLPLSPIHSFDKSPREVWQLKVGNGSLSLK